MTHPLITSDMWQNNKIFAVNIAVGHYLDALYKGIFALRDENGKRPDFSQADILEGIWRFVEVSGSMHAKFELMKAKNAYELHKNTHTEEERDSYIASAIDDFMDFGDMRRVIMSEMDEYEKSGLYK